MNKTYSEYLESLGIISEDLFYDVLRELPDIDIDFNSVDWSDIITSQNELAHDIINEILNNWEYVYAEEVYFDDKSIVLGDVRTLKDLKEIKETFSGWTISNYDDCKESIEEELKEEREEEEKQILLNRLRHLLSIEELKNIINKYDN